MLACGYAQYRNGLFSSFAMLIMVFLSGLAAFGFWEPIADLLDPLFQNNAMAGTEDHSGSAPSTATAACSRAW